jgi:hypothetical protein
MLESFPDYKTGTQIPLTKGDNLDGSFSHSFIDTFLKIDKEGPYAVRKGKKIYEKVVAVTAAELDISQWKNAEAYIEAYRAQIAAEAHAAGYEPATDEEDEEDEDEKLDENELALVEEEAEAFGSDLEADDDVVCTNKVESRIKKEKDEAAEAAQFVDNVIVGDTGDTTESDSDPDVPENNVLNGPFGGVTRGAV